MPKNKKRFNEEDSDEYDDDLLASKYGMRSSFLTLIILLLRSRTGLFYFIYC